MYETSPSTTDHTLFLCGDVMTGRGVDQILPHPGMPQLFEPYARSALDYVALAEAVSGPIAQPVGFDHIWGDALAELDAIQPVARIVNLETAITSADDHWPGKGIHYRMHPTNIRALTAAGIDCCVLANNHVLDWGYTGLQETLQVLHRAGIATAGAGGHATEAAAPAAIPLPAGGRLLIFAIAFENSGVPMEWAASGAKPGVCAFPMPSAAVADQIGDRVRAAKRRGDIVVLSIHWGANWGYHIPSEHRTFARRLIDRCNVDLIHGHSSHHPLGMEIHSGKLVLYGCGDFLNDYEGISGYEQFRGNLTLMYFPTLEPGSGNLLHLALKPMQIRRFRLTRASDADVAWLCQALSREAQRFGLGVQRMGHDTLVLKR
jgi:poly-gamma-glutamate synthesis protein (capsule biosynthesis protein)